MNFHNHVRQDPVKTTSCVIVFVLFIFVVSAGCINRMNSDIDSDETTLESIVVPTLPDVIPGYIEEDPATGLHMTGTPTAVDFASYQLVVSGLVDHELSLTYDDVRRLPKLTASPDLICNGFFVDKATWSGGSLKVLLDRAGVQSDATKIRLKGADGFAALMDLEDAMTDDNFLAYELNGETLPVLHGFPLRAVFPKKYGYFWIKWLVAIEVV